MVSICMKSIQLERMENQLLVTDEHAEFEKKLVEVHNFKKTTH